VLLAGLSNSDVAVGQFVLAGEPVGTMPAAARATQSKAQDNAPVLYVEFRKDQKPIDPEPWWADSAKRVQG
jgi:septal ring factor EnvC (AmiA/AmiB activator)